MAFQFTSLFYFAFIHIVRNKNQSEGTGEGASKMQNTKGNDPLAHSCNSNAFKHNFLALIDNPACFLHWENNTRILTVWRQPLKR